MKFKINFFIKIWSSPVLVRSWPSSAQRPSTKNFFNARIYRKFGVFWKPKNLKIEPLELEISSTEDRKTCVIDWNPHLFFIQFHTFLDVQLKISSVPVDRFWFIYLFIYWLMSTVSQYIDIKMSLKSISQVSSNNYLNLNSS